MTESQQPSSAADPRLTRFHIIAQDATKASRAVMVAVTLAVVVMAFLGAAAWYFFPGPHSGNPIQQLLFGMFVAAALLTLTMVIFGLSALIDLRRIISKPKG